MVSNEDFRKYLLENPGVGANKIRETRYACRLKDYNGSINAAKREAGVPEKYIRPRYSSDLGSSILEMLNVSAEPLSIEMMKDYLNCSRSSLFELVGELRKQQLVYVAKMPKTFVGKNILGSQLRVLEIEDDKINEEQMVALADETIRIIDQIMVKGKRGDKRSITNTIKKNSNFPKYCQNRISAYYLSESTLKRYGVKAF